MCDFDFSEMDTDKCVKGLGRPQSYTLTEQLTQFLTGHSMQSMQLESYSRVKSSHGVLYSKNIED